MKNWAIAYLIQLIGNYHEKLDHSLLNSVNIKLS